MGSATTTTAYLSRWPAATRALPIALADSISAVTSLAAICGDLSRVAPTSSAMASQVSEARRFGAAATCLCRCMAASLRGADGQTGGGLFELSERQAAGIEDCLDPSAHCIRNDLSNLPTIGTE